MIREVHINNYRSIQELSLKLKQINIITGDNSTGKSSILEAIAIASTAPIYRDCISNNILEHIAKRRGKPYYTNLQHLVRNGADYAEITVTDEEATSTVEIYYITKDNSYLLEEDNVLKRLMMLAVNTVISSVQTELDTTQLSRAVNPIMDTDLLSKLTNPETHALALIRSKDFDIKTYVLAVYNYIISDGEEVAVGKLLRLLFIDRLIDVNTIIETQLRNLLHNININNIKIDDIKNIMTDINGTILFKTSTGNIPVNMLGDSTKYLLCYKLLLYTANADTILIDTPEGLHPTHISTLATDIINESKYNNRQFIITTYNTDLIKDIIEKAKGSGIEDNIQLINMYKDNDTVKADPISYKEAAEILNELSMDIRYL